MDHPRKTARNRRGTKTSDQAGTGVAVPILPPRSGASVKASQNPAP